MERILKIKNLQYENNGRKILKNIDLEVGKGEIVGLIGKNGSGKTTLLKCLNGINKISSGDIDINGKKIKDLSPKEIAQNISLMGQDTCVSVAFPCLDIVVMGRYPHLEKGKSFSHEDYEKSLKCMEITDTLKFRDKNIGKLSGGERQRVLFAKCVAQETDIILLDEPTASMDISNQEQLFKLCKKLSEQEKAIIISTHDLRVASRYCDKLLLLKEGEVVAFGSMEEVLTKENIKIAYDIDVEIFINPISKTFDYYIY